MTENEGVADDGSDDAVGDATGADADEGAAAGDAAAADGDEGPSVDADAPTDDRDDGVDGDGTDGEVDPGAGDAEADDADATEDEEGDERDELVERVGETDPEELADEIADLRDRVESLETERDDLESRLKRKQAEFQNYKKRQEKRREEERQRATEDLVERLLDVRDNLRRALETDEDADIRGGVETTLRQFDRVLDAENVERIAPEPGDEVDPQRHEVLMRVESDREPGTVDALHRPGYEMAGKLLRAAQVTVAEEPEDSPEEESEDSPDEKSTD